MTTPITPSTPAAPPVPPRALLRPVLLAWSAVAVAAAAQTVAMVRLEDGRGVDLTRVLAVRLAILPLWAAATPAVLRSARRFPVLESGRLRPRHLALHLALGTLFIVAANAVIRVPQALHAGGLGVLARGTLLGVATYYPLALVVYAAIVALGHRGLPLAAPVDGAAAAPAEQTLAQPAEAATHLTVRQWNRVHLVRLADIDWIGAEDNYVVVHAAGRRYRGRERISDVESRLDARRFVRIHRSTVVHVARIREVQPLSHGDHAVILLDGTVLRVARSRKGALEEALEVRL